MTPVVNFKIGRIRHLSSEIRGFELDYQPSDGITVRRDALHANLTAVQSEISDFGSEMQDSPNFKIPALPQHRTSERLVTVGDYCRAGASAEGP